jgi:ferredoxin
LTDEKVRSAERNADTLRTLVELERTTDPEACPACGKCLDLCELAVGVEAARDRAKKEAREELPVFDKDGNQILRLVGPDWAGQDRASGYMVLSINMGPFMFRERTRVCSFCGVLHVAGTRRAAISLIEKAQEEGLV